MDLILPNPKSKVVSAKNILERVQCLETKKFDEENDIRVESSK
jgi:hypothetical protein